MTLSLNCTHVTPSVCDLRVSSLSPLSRLHTCRVGGGGAQQHMSIHMGTPWMHYTAVWAILEHTLGWTGKGQYCVCACAYVHVQFGQHNSATYIIHAGILPCKVNLFYIAIPEKANQTTSSDSSWSVTRHSYLLSSGNIFSYSSLIKLVSWLVNEGRLAQGECMHVIAIIAHLRSQQISMSNN